MINQQDFLGVSFIAIQALEKRTKKIESLEEENSALRQHLADQQKQIDLLQKASLSLSAQMQTLVNMVSSMDKKPGGSFKRKRSVFGKWEKIIFLQRTVLIMHLFRTLVKNIEGTCRMDKELVMIGAINLVRKMT